MTPADFTAWIDHARTSRQWTQRDCAVALGIDPGQIVRWKKHGAPRYIGLAIAASEAGLKPWGNPHHLPSLIP